MRDRLLSRNVPACRRSRTVRFAQVEDGDRHVTGRCDESLITIARFDDDGQAVADAVAVAFAIAVIVAVVIVVVVVVCPIISTRAN